MEKGRHILLALSTGPRSDIQVITSNSRLPTPHGRRHSIVFAVRLERRVPTPRVRTASGQLRVGFKLSYQVDDVLEALEGDGELVGVCENVRVEFTWVELEPGEDFLTVSSSSPSSSEPPRMSEASLM